MRSQRQLRDELRFVSEFTTLFDVMQRVAMTRLRQAEDVLSQRVPITALLRDEFTALVPAGWAAHPLIGGGGHGRLLVVVTSDEGFAGPLHSAVMREAVTRADQTTQWILIGGRGLRLFGDRAAYTKVLPMPTEESADEAMQRLGEAIVAHVRREGLRDAWLIAPQFISLARQTVAVQQLLPLPLGDRSRAAARPEPIVEPSPAPFIDELARWWVESCCIEGWWSARRAECAARVLHVEASRQSLAKHAKGVRHECFRALHERVDVRVRETCVVRQAVTKHAQRVPAAASMEWSE